MRYIFSGNYHEFINYLRENDLSRSDAVFIFQPEQLRGLRNIVLEKVGTWYRNGEVDKILEAERCIKS